MAVYFAVYYEQGVLTDLEAQPDLIEKTAVQKTDLKAHDLLRSLVLRGQGWSGKVIFKVDKDSAKFPSLSEVVFAQKENKKRYDFTIYADGIQTVVSVLNLEGKFYSCANQECSKAADDLLSITNFPLTVDQLSSVKVQKAKGKKIAGKTGHCFDIDAQTMCWDEEGALLFVQELTQSEGMFKLEAQNLEPVESEFFNLPGKLT